MEVTEVIKERKYKAGYILRDEKWLSHFEDKPKGHSLLMKRMAYNLKDEWIGNSKEAYLLVVKRGIIPEKSKKSHCVCSIGFCNKEQKWYGWSHRALFGFGLGDKIFEEEYGNDHTLFSKHGRITIKNMNDAKKASIAFAESVS